MKNRLQLRYAAMVALAIAAAIAAEPVSTQSQRNDRRSRTTWIEGREAVDGEVIVRYRTETGVVERARAEFQAESDEGEPIGRRGARRMRSRRLGTRAMLQALQANPDVEFAEPNYVVRVGALPNDPFFGSLWGLLNNGQAIAGVAGTAGADISARDAWDLSTGSRSHVIGVIDTGIDYNHPDLAANIWTAPRAFSVVIGGLMINCAAGTHGFNAINNTCFPADDHSHGTHVAGTIGAVGNNGIGVAGVNWVASMMALKFLSASGSGSTADAIKAIEFAIQAKAALGADANVRVLSNSWGGGGFSQALRNQIDAANAADMLFVAAAGNTASNNDLTPHYPSSYTSPNVVSVAATTNRDLRASFTSFGATSVHLGAPGQAILSTVPNGGYASFNGTSMATPHVAGAAALMLANCTITTAELKSALLSSVDPIAALSGITSTGGRLNVDAAIQACLGPAPTLTATLSGQTIMATVTNGRGNPRDWLALYCPATSGDSSSIAWKYFNGTQTPPSSGLESATVAFDAPAGGGVCNVRLFLNGSTTKLATSASLTIAALPPTLNVVTPSVNLGGTIEVALLNGPASPTDWVALYRTGAADDQYQQWAYLNGSTLAPAAGYRSATIRFTAPVVGGNYEVRLFSSNTFIRLATSDVIAVAALPAISIADVAVMEGGSGATTATFTVSIAPPNPTETVTVNYQTANGTATSGSDYLAASGVLTFAPAVTSLTIPVGVTGDLTVEPHETFTVNLSNAANAVIGDAQGTGTITNDDLPAAPTIALGSSTVSPGASFTVTIANGPANARDWVSLGNSAAADATYLKWLYLNGSTVPPAAGLATATVPFTAPTTPGTYNVRLFANDSFTRLATSATFTVSAQPALSVNDVSIAEGHAGTTVATFTVTLSPANAAQSVTVAYQTANLTATTANNDYLAANGTVTFAPSVTSRTFTVTVNGDIAIEPNETFAVNLLNAANAMIGDAQGLGTIVNDDAAAGPAITLASSTVSPGGTITATVLNGPANRTDWLALFNTSAGDSAYLQWLYLNGSRVAPAAGYASATLVFTAPTTPGSYHLRLFASDSFTRLATSGAVSVASQPTLSINDVTVTEGQSGTTMATFTVTLAPPNNGQTVTVDYLTANGTATSGTDYLAGNGTVTFNPGVTTQTIDVTIVGDTAIEPAETFSINLSSAVNAALGDAQGAGTIESDDLLAGPTVTVLTPTVPRGGMITVVVDQGPGNPRDWIGLFLASSAADNSYAHWVYLSGTKVPGSGQSNATVSLAAPMTAGAYQVRFFANDGFTRLATSSTITVTP